jgi:hypothetical protein
MGSGTLNGGNKNPEQLSMPKFIFVLKIIVHNIMLILELSKEECDGVCFLI